MQDYSLLTNITDNSHKLNQSSEKSSDNINQNNNLEDDEEDEASTNFCGLFSNLLKPRRNSKLQAGEDVDDDKEANQHKDLDHTFTGGLSQVKGTVQGADQVKVVEEPSSQPKTPTESAEIQNDRQNQESVEKDETPQISEPMPTLKEAVQQPVPCSNLSEMPSPSSQPSMNIAVSSHKHSVISIEELENETCNDHENLTAGVQTHIKTTVTLGKMSVVETSKSRSMRITFKKKPTSVFDGAKDLCAENEVSNLNKNGPNFQESTIQRTDDISDHEETYDYFNQSNNNAANEISNSKIEFALPEPERKPAKLLQLLREARAANIIPPSLPTPSYSWERKEFIEEDNCMVLPTRKPKKPDEKTSSPSEADTASTDNKTIVSDINKPKPVPSFQDVIETMQKIKEAEAQLKAKKERKLLDEVKDDSGKIPASNQSSNCEIDSTPVNYKERRRLKKEREIEEARKELMEATRNALKDRLEFHKEPKSATNSANISEAMFGVLHADMVHPNTSLEEDDECVDIVEKVQSNDRRGDNLDLASKSEIKVNKDATVKRPEASEIDSPTKLQKAREEKLCKKKIRKKNRLNKHANLNSFPSPFLLNGQCCSVAQTTYAPQNIPNLSVPQPVFIPVPICMSCFGAQQRTQPNYYNHLNHYCNCRAHRRIRRYSISSSGTCTSSDTDLDSYRRNSKLSYSSCSSFGDTSSSISLTNSSFSMSPSDQGSYSHTTSSSSPSFDTASECSVFSFSSSNSEDDSS